MSITDELREYTEKQIKWLDMSKVHYRKIFAIADRIDAEHMTEVERFKAENAKLHDAVMDMYFQIKETCGICDGDLCSNYDEENDCCRFDTIVDELGIEVQE